MIVAIIIWLFIVALCYVYGFAFLKLARLILKSQDVASPTPLICLAGLIVISCLGSFYSILSNVGWIFLILMSAGAAVFVFFNRETLRISILPKKNSQIILLLLIFLVVLENSTHRPNNPDTDIYHAQAIRWIETYPAVPGLGNLHGRLAFNSTWFVTNAVFSFSFLKVESFHLVAGVLFLLFLLYCSEAFSKLAEQGYSLSSLLKITLIPVSLSVFGAELSSPGTDLPANLLIWFVLILWVEFTEQPKSYQPSLMALISCFAVTVKLSAAPILLIPILLFGEAIIKNKISLIWVISGIAVLIFAPFIIRNIILSGYIIYPYPSVDYFTFDWKVPAARVESERLAIMAWGRFPRQDSGQVLSMSFLQWFPAWLQNQTINRRMLFSVGLLSPLVIIPFWLLRRMPTQIASGWLVVFAGTLFWLFTAPDFRFGYGFLGSTILLAVLTLMVPILGHVKLNEGLASRILILLTAIFLTYVLAKSVDMNSLQSRIILPTDYDHVPTNTCNIANTTIHCAKSYNACSYTDFPCIPNPRPWVELRGQSLQDGFRSVP